MANTHFKVIIPMYNCARWVLPCLESCCKQIYKNWQAVICVDPSEDNTLDTVTKYIASNQGSRMILVNNVTRKCVPKNHIDAVQLSNPNDEDVIVLLDGDDSLYDDGVLGYLSSVYQDGLIWITWGSYVYLHNNKRGGASALQPNIKNIRQAPWTYSHLKTFKYFLFKNIKDDDLRDLDTHNYYTVAGDMALMYPMIEMAGRSHSQYIDRILYVYNYSNPLNDDKVNRVKGHKCVGEIQNRVPYREKAKEELLQCKQLV